MTSTNSTRVAIIGAGITGLTAAWRLHREGCNVTVFEKSPRPGGSIRSISEAGWLLECGPNSLQYGGDLRELVQALGLESRLQMASPLAKRRFLARGGRFIPVPSSPPALLGSKLFGLRTKLSLPLELFFRPRVRTTDISLAELVRTHFTQELVDYAVNPLVAGIYAGDPEKLSVRHAFPSLWQAERSHGSLIRGMMAAAKARKAAGGGSAVPPLISFAGGLQTLTDTLAAALPPGALRLGVTVETLLPGKPHRLVWRSGSDTESGEFDAVVLAVPAGALAQLTVGALGERPLAPLENIPHPPVSSLFLGYRREQIAHPLDGFGGLVPAVERRNVLGILFSSTLFPGRAPEGHAALTVFVGGMRQPELGRLPPEQILAAIDQDLRDLVGVQGAPVFVRHNFWPRAIPQYVLGFERWLEVMTGFEDRHAGLFIGGNVRDGISVPDCIKSGLRLAARVTGK
jgi:oxygen-dependent protoporphyrinogen oxidase